MKSGFRVLVFLAVFAIFSPLSAAGPEAGSTLAFTVRMKPAEHLYQVALRAEGLAGEILDAKLPVWMPGYYGLQTYASNIRNFRAEDGEGGHIRVAATDPPPWPGLSSRTG